MSNNLIVLPLLIPLLTGIVLIFINRHRKLVRWVSGVSSIINIFIAASIVQNVRLDGVQILNMSGWEAPFGITFTADMFAALLVLTTALIGAACIFYSFYTIEEQRERHYYYALVQFLLVGVIGSFLTGDIFNLFVCFEVMLVASYGLIVIGGEKRQLRESLKYVLINVLSSTLFVTAIAYLYGSVGTLNMAHLSQRVAEVSQGGILTVIAILLLIVFALKAGLILYFWLPGSYQVPPAAIVALFGGLLTKVGVYAIVRTFTLIFYHDPGITHTLIAWMSGLTMVFGAIGALAYRDVNRILIFNIVISIGFLGFGLSTATEAGQSGVIYYLLHDMIAKTLIFMLAGLLIKAAGTEDTRQMSGWIRRHPALGWMFFVTALAIIGVPPLSGFVGKLLIVEGGLAAEQYLLTGIGLASSLFVILSLVRIFMNAFWGEEQEIHESAVQPSKKALVPGAALLILLVFIGLGAELLHPYIDQAGDVLLNPQLYIDAVLKE